MAQSALKSDHVQLKPKIGMTPEARVTIAKKLGVTLANSYLLFIKTQGVHWNVTGPSFYGLHKLTEAQYENLYEAVDEIAERIRALGEKAPASYSRYGELSSIKDQDDTGSVEDMISMLVADHETVVRSMREAIEPCEEQGDYVTADLLTQRMAWHEESIWMLRSLLA